MSSGNTTPPTPLRNAFTPLQSLEPSSPVYSPSANADFGDGLGFPRSLFPPDGPTDAFEEELKEAYSKSKADIARITPDFPAGDTNITFRAPSGGPRRVPVQRSAPTVAVPQSTPVFRNTIRVLPTVSSPAPAVAIPVSGNQSTRITPPPTPAPSPVPQPPATVVRDRPQGTNRRPPDPNSRRSRSRVRAQPIPTFVPSASSVIEQRQVESAIAASMSDLLPSPPPDTVPDPAVPPRYTPPSTPVAGAVAVGVGRRTPVTGGPTRHLPCLLTPRQRDYLTLHYPGVNFVPGRTENIPHSHPLLACERKWCEEYLVQQATPLGRVVDIGGNASRHHHSGDGVWSCCPILTPEDAPRNFRYIGMAGWCSHKFQQCVCVEPDAYIAVHSIYYLTPDQVCLAVNRAKKHVLWSAHHSFDRAYGTFADGEAHYKVDHREQVVMHSNGNVTDYKHSACAWLNSGYYESPDGTAMAWTIEKTFPNTVIMRFNAAPVGLPDPSYGYRGFLPSMSDTTYYGPMPLAGAFNAPSVGSSPHFIHEIVNRTEFSSWGPFMVTYDSETTESVVLPKGLIHEASSLMVGRSRNEATFATLCSQVRSFMVKYDIPPDLAPRAAIMAATLGFINNLDFEQSMVASLGRHVSTFASMDRLLKFKFPYVVPSYVLPMLSTSLLLVPIRLRLPPVVSKVFLSAGIVLGILPTLWKFSKLLRTKPRFDERYSEGSNGYRYGTASMINIFNPVSLTILRGLAIGFASPQAYPDTDYIRMLRGVRDDKIGYHAPGNELIPLPGPVSFPTVECMNPLLPLTTWRRTPSGGVDRRKLPRVKRIGMTLFNVVPDVLRAVGLIVPEVIPVVHASSANNELHSLHNRVAFVPLAPDLDFVATLREYTLMNVDQLFPHHNLHDLIVDFRAWNRRFPPARRVAHELAHNRDPHMPALRKRAGKLKGFVKLEKRLDANNIEYVEGRPRFIAGGEDDFNVVVGPQVYALGIKLMKIWNKNFAIFFTGGSNAEEIGEWFSLLGHNHPGYDDSDADFRSFDSTQFMELLKLEIEINRILGLPKEICELMEEFLSHHGATAHGVVFYIYDGRASGRPNTMHGNSVINGITKVFAIQCSNPHVSLTHILNHIKIAVVGDDGVDRVAKFLQKNLDHHLRRLGLNSVITPRPDSRHLEYCSSRFWPTSDGHVLGRKIGLALPKLGYYINQSTRKIFGIHKSSLIGEYLNTYFIPPLASIVQTQLTLLKHVRARPIPLREKGSAYIKAVAKHDSCGDTWEMLAAVYGWDRSDQYRLDGLLSTLVSLPSLIPMGYVDKLLVRDSDLSSWRPYLASLWHSYDWFLNPRSDTGMLFEKEWDVNVSQMLRVKFPYLKNSVTPYEDYVNTIFIAPVFEEFVKKVWIKGIPVGAIAMPLVECAIYLIKARHMSDGDFAVYSLVRLAVVGMHWLWACLPLEWSIPFHMFWNACALQMPAIEPRVDS